MIRVILPTHLRRLANSTRQVDVDVEGAATIGSLLDALESKYPMLRGTIRDQMTFKRRPFVRFFACGKDISLESADSALPEQVTKGTEPFYVVGAMAGG